LRFSQTQRFTGLSREGSGVVVSFEDDAGKTTTERFALALVATGRRPNFAGLGLETTGIALGADGVPLFDRATLQCGAAPVFIAGDATSDLSVLHEATDEGRIAGANAALYPTPERATTRSRLLITFSDPQIAVVGSGFQELSRQGQVLAGSVDFGNQGRSRVMAQNRGLARLYADPASRRFLGAEIAGPRAEHLGHLLAWAHQQQLTIDEC
jgi:dihydrolipoamide dehydrogenase